MVATIAVLIMIRNQIIKIRKNDTHNIKKILGMTEFSIRTWCFPAKSGHFIVDLPLSNVSNEGVKIVVFPKLPSPPGHFTFRQKSMNTKTNSPTIGKNNSHLQGQLNTEA